MNRRLPALLLTAALLLNLCCVAAFAVEDSVMEDSGLEDSLLDDEEESTETETQNETPDPTDSRVTFDDYDTRPLKEGETLIKGIDVSEYQGYIDWTRVAADGVDFAFIRVGYRGYGGVGKLVEDQWYKWNLTQAIRAGIDVGVYIYSQATTVQEAQEEARFVMDKIKGYDIQMPIVMDLEFAWTGYSQGGRLWDAVASGRLNKATLTGVCNAFCKTVEAAGYDSMVYCNTDMALRYINAPQISRIWLANYTSMNPDTGKYPASSYQGDYEYWQFTSNGKVDGIEGRCDLNFWFCPETEEEPEQTPTIPEETPEDPEETPEETEPVKMPFLDVTGEDWFHDYVAYVYSEGIVNGTSATTFEPNSQITRGQMVTMLYRMEGSPEVTGKNSFTDLTQEYYRTPILWANQNGIVLGRSETVFDPEGQLSREDLVTILYRYAGKPEFAGDLSAYQDSDLVADYARDAMAWAVENQIVVGLTTDTLAPQGTATRAQIAAVLCRYILLCSQ